MGKMGRYTVSLDEEVVFDARERLDVGQKLSPVLNQLLVEWIKLKGDVEDES